MFISFSPQKHMLLVVCKALLLIVLGFNECQPLWVIFCCLPEKREKRDKSDSRRDERDEQGRKRNKYESEETE